jgi:hypothetical protein
MQKAEVYDRYPVSSLVIYNGATILHFLAGGLILSFSFPIIGSAGIAIMLLYPILSFLEMYLIMPLKVCPHCVYFRIPGGRCVSGLHKLARIISKQGNPSNFPKRALGLLCQNNLYILALTFPILAGVVILIFRYNTELLLLEIGLVLLLVLRFFFIIPRMACVHCRAKQVCPQAGQMGVRDK